MYPLYIAFWKAQLWVWKSAVCCGRKPKTQRNRCFQIWCGCKKEQRLFPLLRAEDWKRKKTLLQKEHPSWTLHMVVQLCVQRMWKTQCCQPSKWLPCLAASLRISVDTAGCQLLSFTQRQRGYREDRKCLCLCVHVCARNHVCVSRCHPVYARRVWSLSL